MQGITTVGLDIAKSVFQVHGVDAQGGVIIRRRLARRRSAKRSLGLTCGSLRPRPLSSRAALCSIGLPRSSGPVGMLV